MTGYPPNRNSSITAARETGRIVRDLMDVVEIDKIDSNLIISTGWKTKPEPKVPSVTPVGPTVIVVGEQASIDCGAVLTDALSSFVTLCCQNVADSPVFQALQSMARVAGRITYNWTVIGGNLIVNVYNDSEVDTNAMVWYVMT